MGVAQGAGVQVAFVDHWRHSPHTDLDIHRGDHTGDCAEAEGL
jgi:hypothetical protein